MWGGREPTELACTTNGECGRHGLGTVVTEPQAMAPYLTDWRGLFHRRAEAVVRPVSTEEVAKVVALCARLGLAITPQGGNTGMSGGATPAAARMLDPAGPAVGLISRFIGRNGSQFRSQI